MASPTTKKSPDRGSAAHFGIVLLTLGWTVIACPQTPPAAPLPTVGQVVKSYVDSVGGQEALDAVKTWEMTGHLLEAKRFDPDKTKVELFWKAPEKSLLVLKSLNSRVVQGYDGGKAWILKQHGHGHNLSTERFDILLILANPLRFTRLPTIYPGASVEGKATLDGRGVTVLLVNVQWGDRRFSFDDETHYLVQIEDHFKAGDPPRFTRLRDYRKVENLRIPHIVQQDWMSQLEGGGVVIDKVKMNAPIRDIAFENPR